MDASALLLIIGIQTSEYIDAERQKQVQHSIQVKKPEQQDKSANVPMPAPAPIIERRAIPIRICKKGEVPTDCKPLTQADIGADVTRGHTEENVDNPLP